MSQIRTIIRCLSAMLLVTAVVTAGSAPASAEAGASSTVFINELHYDNAGTDTGEFIEVAGPAGTDLTGWSLVLYNGNNSSTYNTINLAGTLVDQGNGYGVVVADLPTNGLQNGSPDGMALVQGSTVVQFLSYEGSITAANGPASGMTSADIGVSEPSTTPIGSSLHLTGSGTTAGDFIWAVAATSSEGLVNDGQSFSGEPDPARVVINEVDYDQSGTDTTEYVELYNGGGSAADLTGWSLELVNGNGGSVYLTVPLSGSLAVGEYLVICGETTAVANCSIDAGAASNLIQNGSPDAMRLLDGDGATVDALSYEGDVAGAVEGSGTDLADVASGVRSISRLPDGADTDQNNIDFVVACSTPGEENAGEETGCGEPVFIHDIQGAGLASDLVGQEVTIEGVIVGDYEGPSPALRGFYVQEEDQDADANPLTSEGIFVFNFDNDSVELGDLVRVTAVVEERFGQTQLGFPSELEVLSSDNTVTPAEITLPLTSPDDLEAVEGMLVTAPQTLYVTEFFQLGRFGQIVVSSGDRLDNPTAVAEPGPDAIAVQDANDLNRLIIDDATNDQNPDPIFLARGGDELTASNTLRGADTVTGIVGVMTYTWSGNRASGNAYRLRPIGDLSDSGLVAGGVAPNFEAANPRPTAVPDVGGRIQVASFNVLNYFLTTDEGANRGTCGPNQDQGCRGADSDLELERQRTKLLTALDKLDAEVIGLIEMENTPGVSPEGDLAAGLNELNGSDDWVAVDAAAVGGGVVGSDTIRVGFIYDSSAVAPVGDPALLDFSLDSLGEGRSRTAVAQTFVELSSGEVFSTVVNHFKSKGGSEIDDGGGQCSIDPTYADCDQGDGQGYFNDIRTTHAVELVSWLNSDPTGSGDADWIVMGDFNAYGMEDPIDVFVDAGYVDLAPDDYSFAFNGQWGSLDYLFGSPSIVGSVTEGAHYHINADEPSALDYNTNFKSANHVETLYAPDEYRTSDHDPALVGLVLDGAAGFELEASPDLLWPPNHKYRSVTVSASGGNDPMTVWVLSADSSEADSGLDDDDVPIDIGTIDGDSIDLRAERFSTDGRTYTVYVRVTDGSQTLFTSTEVHVPHSRGG